LLINTSPQFLAIFVRNYLSLSRLVAFSLSPRTIESETEKLYELKLIALEIVKLHFNAANFKFMLHMILCG
jgi:hypothetical protein